MVDLAQRRHDERRGVSDILNAVPPHAYFVTSAIFHYLGPSFAVLLFAQVPALVVLWLRVATAAAIFVAWRRPWRRLSEWSPAERRALIALGIILGLMNASFYLAIERLPLGTVGAIEFVGPIVLAAIGARGWRNLLALGLAIVGAALLADVRLEGERAGFLFAAANCLLFALYIVLGHHIVRAPGCAVDKLAAAMGIALLVTTPLGFREAWPALTRPELLVAGIGVGLCSSVIPYVSDQLAMARLPRATFALMLALLPACASAIGFLVLGQRPEPTELTAIALVVCAVALHQRGDR